MELGVTAVMLPELDFVDQIELCVELGIRYYQYRPRLIPEDSRDKPYDPWGRHEFDLTPARLKSEGAALTGRLRDAGLEPWGTVPQISVDSADDEIKLHLEGAAVAEAKCVRCSPLNYPDEPFDYGELLDRNIESFGRIIEKLSSPMNLKLLIETHCRSLATSPALAWNICRHFSPERIGVIFDLPNFAKEGEVTPRLAVSILKDYIDCLHVGGTRRIIKSVDSLGCKLTEHQFCSLDESDLHTPTWLACLRDAGLDPPLVIEDFTPAVTGSDRLRRTAPALKTMLNAL